MLTLAHKHYIENAATAWLRELVAISSPYFEEASLIGYLEDRLKQSFKTTVQTYEERNLLGHPFSGVNLIADFGDFTNGFVVLNGHVDTVIRTNDWEQNPLELRIEGDRCSGLGALDMKGGLTAFIVAMETMRHFGLNPTVGLRLNAVSDEEGPYSLGTLNAWRAGFYKGCMGVIIGEPVVPFSCRPVTFPAIAIGGRGRYYHSVLVKGKPGHGAMPRTGINAVIDAARICLDTGKIPLKSHDLLGQESVCVLQIQGGVKTLTIPDLCRFDFDRHVVPDTSLACAEQEFYHMVEGLGLGSSVTLEFSECLPDGVVYQPYGADHSHPFVRRLGEACHQATGRIPDYTGMLSICDMNVLGPRISAPVVLFGPTGENPHKNREWVSLRSICSVVESLISFFLSEK